MVVYQGDPLSVVIFNTVINTLIDTLQSWIDLGYNFSNSNHQVNLLQYADDTCILANSPASAQHLLDMTSDWLQWSGMKAKVTKCHSLVVAGSCHQGNSLIPSSKLVEIKFHMWEVTPSNSLD